MSTKRRLSASVDEDLLAAAERAVQLKEAESVSAWVNDAMRKKLENDKRLRALAAYIKQYEAEFGVITEDDMVNAEREAKRRTITTRGLRAGESRRKYGR
jgi:metal-responsive CopG/Arc/MetJ family transcriptional regulator